MCWTLGAFANAQTWSTPFHHETITTGPVVPNPNATDHLAPFGGYTNANITYYSIGSASPFDWAGKMNAVHMSLIPKGPHQGKVLVWGTTVHTTYLPVGLPVIVRDSTGSGNPSMNADEYWVCNAWSIVDPALSPTGPRFRNFLLPIQTWIDPNPGGIPTTRFPSLFCSGHAWSPYGDLIVAGGTFFGITTLGAKLTYAFNPKALTAGWPPPLTSSAPLYGSELGLWQPGPPLLFDRFYPTVTMTARLDRLQIGLLPPREVAVITGGDIDATLGPPGNPTWNSYEALIVDGEAIASNAKLGRDSYGGTSVWPGPGSPLSVPPYPEVEEDWLGPYPRFHYQSTGKLFFSGYAPRWAYVDHDVSPGSWTRQAAPPPYSATAWQHPRHDGTSVLFPNVAGTQDIVMRIGGSDESVYSPPINGTTATTEAFLPDGAGGGIWFAGLDLPNPQPGVLPSGRHLMNVVILPDASLFLVGGNAVAPAPSGTSTPVLDALLYDGTWNIVPRNPVAGGSPRDYHSTAVLLPDGRVMIGGGNGRLWDYEFFSPAYLKKPALRPTNVAFATPVPYSTQFTSYEIGYGEELEITCDPLPLGVAVQKAVLIAPGACTHHSDMHQRYVEMETSQLTPNNVYITTPPNEKHAPRGIFMLFLVTNQGTVSNAIWVVLR